MENWVYKSINESINLISSGLTSTLSVYGDMLDRNNIFSLLDTQRTEPGMMGKGDVIYSVWLELSLHFCKDGLFLKFGEKHSISEENGE